MYVWQLNGQKNHKWRDLKRLLITEIEAKRVEEAKKREIPNEEVDDDDDDDDNDIAENDDEDNGNNDEDIDEVNNELNDEKSDEEVDDDKDDEDEEVDDEEVDDEEADDEEADDEEIDNEEKEMNCFIDNEAIDDDDEEEREVKDNFVEDNESDDEKDDKHDNHIDEVNQCNNEENADEDIDVKNESFFSINSLNESFQRTYATQHIELSPYDTQSKYRKRISDISDCDIKRLPFNCKDDNECYSQDLLDLCSGVFTSNNGDDNDDDELGHHRKQSQKFNLESDDEENEILTQEDPKQDYDGQSDDEESKILTQEDPKQDYDGQSDDEEDEILTQEDPKDDHGQSDDDDDNEDIEDYDDEDIEKHKRGFIEEEAELSGSDASSDEDEDGDGDEYEEDEEQEELPDDEQLRDEIGRIHNKRLLDEDKREVLLYQELLFDDGDMHDDGKTRDKKFRWNTMNTQLQDGYINSLDSDSGSDAGDDDEEVKAPILKMQNDDNNDDAEKRLSSFSHSQKCVIKPIYGMFTDESESKTNLSLRSCGQSSVKSNYLANFIVRDERLKNILSTKRPSPMKNINKKFKKAKYAHSKKNESIFDVLSPA